jgi:hypothetical protein
MIRAGCDEPHEAAAGAAWPAVWLALAAVVYGLFGSPTPDAPGWAELAAGICLVLAAGPLTGAAAAAGADLRARRGPGWPAVAALGFAIALWPALIRGMAAGWPAATMVRDLLPLAFLFLPLFLARRLAGALGAEAAVRLVAGTLALVGVLFAARYFAITGLQVGWLGEQAPSDGLLYLANSPAVPFAAVLLPLLAFERLAGPHPARWPAALAMLAGGALCAAALAATLQRAALAAAGLAAALYLARRAIDRPQAVLAAVAAGAALLALEGDWAGRLGQLLAWKTAEVGLNQHAAEIAVALDVAARSPGHALFGAGWGALFESPAVPGYRVGYLHALPLYLLAKGGILGLLAVGVYLLALAPAFARLWAGRPALASAAAAPLAVGLLIQPSFKYLGFGLVLTLVALAAGPGPVTGPGCSRAGPRSAGSPG